MLEAVEAGAEAWERARIGLLHLGEEAPGAGAERHRGLEPRLRELVVGPRDPGLVVGARESVEPLAQEGQLGPLDLLDEGAERRILTGLPGVAWLRV